MHTSDGHHGHLLTSARFKHSQNRSSSIGPLRANSASKAVPKIKSSNALADMAALQTNLSLHSLEPGNGSEESLSTIPDPRNTSSSDLSRTRSPSPRHPDLSDEVAKLSDKLINAINHQTALEDSLAQARHEVDTAGIRIQRLEAEARAHEEQITSGLLIPKTDVDNEKSQLIADLTTERKQKVVILQEKRGIEGELENLTASLFEEANKMVAAANKERDVVEKRNRQLRDQVKDTESLLANQQEQLTQLKIVMQQMGDENGKDEGSESAKISTAPASPSSYKERDGHVLRLLEAMNLSPRSAETGGDISPAPSMTLTHLLKPVYRTDLPAYEDFRHLLSASQKSHPASRVTSGSYAGLSVMGLSGLTSSSTSPSQPPNNSSSTSLNMTSNQTATISPQFPGSFSPNSSTDRGPVPLKEVKFYKRLLVEDIEPTLRLDLSPTISWLSRRSILSALAENGLIVEPIPDQGIKLYGRITPCALCGEARKDIANPRTHRMRVSDGEGATKWALCGLCLEKVRATCDLVGYVRMVRDAVVRCADKDEEQEAWEELIRLRERLFWARMAGGVVPSFIERMSEKGSPIIPSSRDATQEEAFADSKTHQSNPPSPSHHHHHHHQTPTNNPSTPTDSPPPDPETAAASAQLHRNLSDSMTTSDSDPSASMPGIRDVTPKTPPRFPVREKRGGSWGTLKVNVPKAFQQLKEDVNVLH
jgi:Rab guanine nucleotide exchange factor SEC2